LEKNKEMLSEVFWSFLITSVIGCSIGVVRMCYKSKCETIQCCGLIIKRNVEIEEKEEEFRQTHPVREESKEQI
jgi:hypothetical protein